jgi:hypothetical protein
MSEMQNVIASLSGNLTKKDKRWLSAQINRIQTHESQMALLNAFAKDPEMKYYLGVVFGSASAVAVAMATGKMDDVLPAGAEFQGGEGEQSTKYQPGTFIDEKTFRTSEEFASGEARQGWIHSKKRKGFIYVPRGYVQNLSTGEVISKEEMNRRFKEKRTQGPFGIEFPEIPDMMGLFNNAFSMVGMGFAGFCGAVLLLKAIFGEDGLSQLPFSGGIV